MTSLPTRAQVLETLLQRWDPVSQTETIPVEAALGRVLTRDQYAQATIPVARASAMDGVAVCAVRFGQGMPDTAGWKLGVDFCRADTGDDFDDRFDAVIPIERVQISEKGQLTILGDMQVRPGDNIRPRGSAIRTGELVARKHRQLRPFDLACLAMGGIAQVEVYRRPRVAFIPTGSELVPLGAPVGRGQTIDSNTLLAQAMLTEMGAEPLCYPIVPDQPGALAEALEQALQAADILLLNGGSSKGAEDYNARLLEERGAALFHWVAAAPGKPLCVGLIQNKPVINLPGPPMAVLYGMDWCVRAMVHRLLHKPMPRRQTIQGILTEPIQPPKDMEILCMMEVQPTQEGYLVKRKPWRGGSMADALGAGAVYVTELGRKVCPAGETLEVTLLRGLEDF